MLRNSRSSGHTEKLGLQQQKNLTFAPDFIDCFLSASHFMSLFSHINVQNWAFFSLFAECLLQQDPRIFNG